MKRTTRQAKQTRFVAYERDGVRVIRDTETHDYELQVFGQYAGSFPTQHAAEQAGNQVVFDALNERKAA